MSLLPYDIEQQEAEKHIVLYLPIPAPSSGTVNAFRREMYRLHNLVRKQAKLPLFTYNTILEHLAQQQAGFMSSHNLLEHTVDLGNKITQANYMWSTLGENVAYHTWTGNVTETAEAIFRGWMNSPGHRKNILNPAFRDIGIGFWVSKPKVKGHPGLGFSTAIFGTPLH